MQSGGIAAAGWPQGPVGANRQCVQSGDMHKGGRAGRNAIRPNPEALTRAAVHPGSASSCDVAENVAAMNAGISSQGTAGRNAGLPL